MSQRVGHGRDEQGKPLFVIASERVGIRKAMRVLTFMAAWDKASQAMRRSPITLDEYAEWWRESRSTAFREQRLFREAFPGESTPDRLLALARVQWDERRGVSALGQVTFRPA